MNGVCMSREPMLTGDLCMYEERSEVNQQWVSPLVTLHPSFLRQGRSLNLELTALTNLTM